MSDQKINAKYNTYDFSDSITFLNIRKFLNDVDELKLYYENTIIINYYGNDNVLNDVIPFFIEEKFRINKNFDSNFVEIVNDNLYAHITNRKSPIISTLKIETRTNKKDGHIAFKEKILKNIKSKIVESNMFGLDWYFSTNEGIKSKYVQEIAYEKLIDEAYPCIDGSVENFVKAYLESNESVLILSGPPGTGKTSLIKYILGMISKKKGKISTSIYSGDQRAFESENTFIKFVTGEVDAFVIEDADHLLSSREDGNMLMHNFLKSADGLVSTQGRKIIFSVNLNKKDNIDEAYFDQEDVLNI